MQDTTHADQKTLARYAGISLLGSIVIGIIASMTVSKGIDINLSADVVATAEAMMDANLQLRAKAYVGVLSFAVGMVSSVALYLLLRRYGPLVSMTSLFLSLMGAALALLGSVFAMNAAQIASNSAYTVLSTDAQRLMLTGLQATSDYTAFHLGLIISTAANAGFFYLLFKSKLIPPLISGWGVFASIFVVSMIVMRDFIPALGHSRITIAFMVSNLLALVAIGLFLSFRGVRET